jgi:hypothetical protein
MTIDPTKYRTVLERYLEIGPNKEDTLAELDNWLDSLNDHLQTFRSELKDPSRTVKEKEELRNEIKSHQHKRTTCLDQIKQVKAIPERVIGPEFVNRRTKEFSKICSLAPTIGVAVGEDKAVVVTLAACVRYRGVLYDIGDWSIAFGSKEEPTKFQAYPKRQVLKPDWRPGTPPEYSFTKNGFCFGDNTDLIEKLFIAGNYLQAVQMIAALLSFVNDGDRHKIPEAFYPADSSKRVILSAQSKIGKIGVELWQQSEIGETISTLSGQEESVRMSYWRSLS